MLLQPQVCRVSLKKSYVLKTFSAGPARLAKPQSAPAAKKTALSRTRQ
jgi:hypothetical protein